MHKGRLEAFSDGVIAIIITIMVLELKVPHGADLASLSPLIPVFLSYVLSFIYIGIYWNNHHHLLQAVKGVSGPILLANLHLLFWLSMIPFATAWMGENHFAPTPARLYGLVLLLSGFAYWLMQHALLRHEGPGSTLALAVGRDLKGYGSLALYAIAIGVSFVSSAVSVAIYVLVAVIWFAPDLRIERRLKG